MEVPEDRYRSVLAEIKRRTTVMDSFLSGRTHAIYLPTTAESICLQVRKVLELIAFSSLIANIELYSREYEKFASHWNARLMLRDVERVNPEFYPRPIIQNESHTPGVKSDWADREDDYLTKERFAVAYEKCGAIMHADNPYGGKTDYGGYLELAREWRTRIVNLLNAHTIRLVNDEKLYLFQMGSQDCYPSFTAFAPLRRNDA